jgi:hypothetical protein
MVALGLSPEGVAVVAFAHSPATDTWRDLGDPELVGASMDAAWTGPGLRRDLLLPGGDLG